MTTAENFIQRARDQGYSDQAIKSFLMQSKKPGDKERKALGILERTPSPDAETEALISERGMSEPQAEQSQGSGMATKALSTAAGLGTAYALGGPIAAGLQGAGQAAGAIAGEGEEGAEDVSPEQQQGIGQVLFNLGKKGFQVPSMKDAITLFNTYRRRGTAHTMAQFASLLMKNLSKEDAPEGQEAGAMAEGQEGVELPEPIRQEADQQASISPDITSAAVATASTLLSPGHKLRNLARTLQERSGMGLDQLIEQYLSSKMGGQQPQQAQAQAQPQQAGVDLSSLSDQELDALMRQRGLL